MSRPTNGTDPAFRIPVTIASGAARSEGVDITRVGPRGFGSIVPNPFTGANLGLEASHDWDGDDDAATWSPVRDETGNVVRITNIKTAERDLYPFPAAAWVAGVCKAVRLVSLNTSADAVTFTTVNQGGSREIILLLLS